MKYGVFALLVLVGLSQASFSQELIGSKIKLQGADDISARANRGSTSFSSPSADLFQNPLINSAVNGFGSMAQGYNNESRTATEQAKQQLDYAKQQLNNNE